MRILLALITVFAVFQAQAYCYLLNSESGSEAVSDIITLDLDTPPTSIKKAINLTNHNPNFKCTSDSQTPNVFTLSTAKSSESIYILKNGIHDLVLKVALAANSPTNTASFANDASTYKAQSLNDQLSYTLTYSVQRNYTGNVSGTTNVDTSFLLDNYVEIKPLPCDSKSCEKGNNNSSHEYRNRIMLQAKFTPTTCTFKSQEISAPDISHHEIDSNGFAAPKPKQPELQCSSITGVATSNIHYHFESISATQGDILKNDLETQQGSAGEVGFQLMNNNKAINFPSSERFTIAKGGSELLDNTIYPLNLQLRYARYGNKVSAGKVQSRVKVVVDYD